MIEINLLPEELRKAEGTPPARLGAIIGSVVVFCVLGFFQVTYLLIHIPNTEANIQTAESEISSLQKFEADLATANGEINTLKAKVAALDNLTQSRVRFSRLLDRLCSSMPDGVWFKTFTINPDTAGSAAGGKRYQVSLSGFTTGGTQLERERKLTDLIGNIVSQFKVPTSDEIRAATKANSGQLPPEFGFNKFLGARFFQPQIISSQYSPSLPEVQEITEQQKKQINQPKDALDFSITLSFELPPPKL